MAATNGVRMTQDRSIDSIFNAASELDSEEERSAYVKQACGGDTEFERNVARLLKAHFQDGRVLDAPAHLKLAGLDDMDQLTRSSQIDHYKLLEKLGEGGFGTVWVAEQREPVKRRVALKIIKLGMDTREVIARFEAERQALAMMEHPNIARILDAGSTDAGRPYFVMELVRGTPIHEYCNTAKLDTDARLKLFIDVCQAIQHAHLKGIIHRDIKPTNILVTMHDGVPVPKVIDFGIAKATNAELTTKTLYTQHRQLVGTPAYMSPEQAEMSGLDIDTRSDIYSLGVLLYELLTGTQPFDTDSLAEVGFIKMMQIICEKEHHRPSDRLSSLGDTASETAARQQTNVKKLRLLLTGDLDWIIMKCLEKDRTRRYETASGLAADIRRHLNNEPVVAGPPGTGYRISKFIQRNRRSVLSCSIIVLALLAGLAGTTYGLLDANKQRKLSAERADEAELARAAEMNRAEELQQVVDFQSRQLGQIVPDRMGQSLRESIMAAVPADQQEDFEQSLKPINFTNVALKSIKENVFDTARQAIRKEFGDQPRIETQLLSALANTMIQMGMLDAAAEVHEQSLQIRRARFGNDDRETLASMNNLGYVLVLRSKFPEANALLTEAIGGYSKLKLEDDAASLSAISNMGLLLSSQNQFAEAKPYYEKALDGFRRLYGNDHPDTLGSVNNVGNMFKSQGKLASAEPYYRETLEGARRLLGNDHPHTITIVNNMATLLRDLGKLEEAEVFQREVLESCRRILGDDHPNTLTAINNMGVLALAAKETGRAEKYCREAVDARRRILGDEHVDTLLSLECLVSVLIEQSRYEEAERYCHEAVQGRTRVLGSEHVKTLKSIRQSFQILLGRSSFAKAEEQVRKSLLIHARVLGTDHPQTVELRKQLDEAVAGQNPTGK